MFRTGDEKNRREKSVGIGKSSQQKRWEERGVSSSYDTVSESGLDLLPDYDEDEAGVGSIPGGTLAGERPSACC